MKKHVLKSTKSIVVAVAICAGLALGAFAAVAGAETPSSNIAGFAPWFIEGGY